MGVQDSFSVGQGDGGRTGRRAFLRAVPVGAVLGAGAIGGVVGSAITALRPVGDVAIARAGPSLVSRMPANADTDLAEMYRRVGGAVVSVQTGAVTRSRSGSAPRSDVMPIGEGTGFIVDGDGTIFTNYHVIDKADRVSVVLVDGTRLEAKVIGTDAASDLALLRAEVPIDRTGIAVLGDSDLVRPGDLAVAIGTPFGLDHTITAGIISAVGREFGTTPSGRPARGLIQTDAPINPGNSGGPLFNAAGEVVGITTSIESPVRGSVGIGFAVPINRARTVLTQVRAGKTAEPAWLGVSIGVLTSDVAKAIGLPSAVTTGLVISQVVPGGPAAGAGLRGSSAADGAPRGDVIVAIDDVPVARLADLSSYLDRKVSGDVVTITAWRGAQRITPKVTLQTWPATS